MKYGVCFICVHFVVARKLLESTGKVHLMYWIIMSCNILILKFIVLKRVTLKLLYSILIWFYVVWLLMSFAIVPKVKYISVLKQLFSYRDY